MPEVAMAFVTLRESWRGLVPMKRRESLAQVKVHKFYLRGSKFQSICKIRMRSTMEINCSNSDY